MFAQLCLMLLGTAHASIPGSIGLGVSVGSPNGLAGKLRLGEGQGLQFSIGGRAGLLGELAISSDFVQELPPVNNPEDGYSLPLYFGGGVSVGANTNSGEVRLGPRAVGGVAIYADGVPLDIFIELSPTLIVLPYLSWTVDGQIGARYYF
jgi:hypothetical protein